MHHVYMHQGYMLHGYMYHRHMHHGHICVGHTAWAPEGCEGRSQGGPKGRRLEVGARRAPQTSSWSIFLLVFSLITLHTSCPRNFQSICSILFSNHYYNVSYNLVSINWWEPKKDRQESLSEPIVTIRKIISPWGFEIIIAPSMISAPFPIQSQ